MKNPFSRNALCAAALLAAVSTIAQVPGIVTYQGRVTSHDTNFTGLGQFRFALVSSGIFTTTYWSHDGNSTPRSFVTVPVTNGLFTVALGDTNLAGMEIPIPPDVFDHANVRLRIWFNDGASGFAQLAPDQRLTSVGYAMRAANVLDGAITSTQLATGAVGVSDLADGVVTTPKLADMAATGAKVTNDLVLGHATASGSLRLVSAFSDVVSIELNGFSGDIRSYGTDGLEDVRLAAGLNGQLLLNDGPGNENTVDLNAGSTVGGSLSLKNSSGNLRSSLLGGGAFDGGELRLRNASHAGVTLFGNAPDTVAGGLATSGGGFDLFGGEGNLRLALRGASGTMSLYQTDGDPGVILRGQGGSGTGEVDVHDSAGTRRLSLQGLNGRLQFYSEVGAATMRLTGDAGELVASRIGVANSVNASVLQASFGLDSNGGVVRTRDENDNTTSLLGSDAAGGYLRLYQSDGTELVTAEATGDGSVTVRQADNTAGARLTANNGTGGGAVNIWRDNGTFAGQLTVADSAGYLGLANSAGVNRFIGVGANAAGGAALYLLDSTGAATVVLDSDRNNEGRITTQVMEITGGADLSENFDIQTPNAEPGMVVSINPERPGELAVSTRAYDRTVAGVMSGAGGVKPGMLMSQKKSKADGAHPVALTGRVYCLVDAGHGAIAPGDLITTSDTPGHGMKVTDHPRAQGAIIGKAMTGLATGTGLVLVLVSLQ